MSLIDQDVQLRNLAPLLRSTNIKGFLEGQHFILMAMEGHDAPMRDMDCFIKEHVHLFHDR
jgi:hypothetical protein